MKEECDSYDGVFAKDLLMVRVGRARGETPTLYEYVIRVTGRRMWESALTECIQDSKIKNRGL